MNKRVTTTEVILTCNFYFMQHMLCLWDPISVHQYTTSSTPQTNPDNRLGKSGFGLFLQHISHHIPINNWNGEMKHFCFAVPASVGWAVPCSRGGGGGRPGEDVNNAPELVRDGGRRGPEDPEPLEKGRETLAEGGGGRMEDEDVPTDEADGWGLTGVLLPPRKQTQNTTVEPKRCRRWHQRDERRNWASVFSMFHTCCRWIEFEGAKRAWVWRAGGCCCGGCRRWLGWTGAPWPGSGKAGRGRRGKR